MSASHRVCALGKAAYKHDRELNPTSLEWDFAFAVFTLHRHPMRGLLQGAGMKPYRPRWDGFLLIVTALLPVVAVGVLVRNGDGTLPRSAGIASGCVAIMLSMFLASRRIEKQRLEEDIERSQTCLSLCGLSLGRNNAHEAVEMNSMYISPEQFRRLSERILEIATNYLEGMDARAITPAVSGAEMESSFALHSRNRLA